MIFLGAFIVNILIGGSSGYLVNTTNGPIIGEVQSTYGENKTYYSFRGVPYAKPPVGDLRFTAPVQPDNWTVPKVTTQDGDECYQSPHSGSEDCLYLNVYTPAITVTEKLPVMVWVYGGVFLNGNGDAYSYGPDFLLEKDVVVVSFNYRLGVFGFLSTEDEVALGNWGLKDQLLALHWIQDNIELFGGDKNSVTLFGQSAGSAAVSYVSQSAQSKGLIHKVILHSGTSINIWALSRPARAVAFRIGEALGINASDSKTLIDELRKVDSLTLNLESLKTYVFATVIDNPRNGLIFGPVIEPDSDQSVVTWKSHEKLSKCDFPHIPIIIGFNSQEAGLYRKIIEWLRLLIFVYYDLNPTKLVPIDMNLNTSDILTQIAVSWEIKSHYFGLDAAALSDDHLIQMISDDQFVRPIHEAAKIMSNCTSVYQYRFSYVGDQEKASRGNNTMVFHGDELFWIFKTGNRSQDLGDSDLAMRHKMVTMWTNFAKYGNPTPTVDPTLDSVTWSQVDTKDVYYLEIGEQLSMNNNWTFNSIDFWQKLYNTYGNPPYDTY